MKFKEEISKGKGVKMKHFKKILLLILKKYIKPLYFTVKGVFDKI